MKWLAALAAAVVGIVVVGEILAFGNTILFKSERPPIATTQLGYRGTGLVDVYNPRTREDLVEANRVPYSVPYAADEGEKAGEVYENVQVLGDVGTGEFARLMVNITEWVAPEKGCAACHNVENFAEDSVYTKVVARRMLQMTKHINANWTKHVQQTGVTCYTCHRGQLVPPNIWFNNPGPDQAGGMAQAPAGQNHPSAPILGKASLPLDPFTPFLEAESNVRIQGTVPLAGENRHSIKQAEWTYALMMHMSQALGVNCSYCHNSRAFKDWAQSPPQRTTAWYGIRMVRDLNNAYLSPLQKVFPAHRLGPALADAPKANCATCHNGVYKPLFGVSMAQNFPELTKAPAPTTQ